MLDLHVLIEMGLVVLVDVFFVLIVVLVILLVTFKILCKNNFKK